MNHIGDFIQSGLLGALGWDDQQNLEEHSRNINMGGPSPTVSYGTGKRSWSSGGSFPPQQFSHGALASMPQNAVWNPEQQDAYPILSAAVQKEAYSGHTYQVGRRLLGIPFAQIPYNESGDEDGAGKDHNRRAEHQHFIGSDGINFGLNPSGIFEENPEELSKYTFDIPNIEDRRMKGVYIDAAREKIERRWQEIERLLEDKNSRSPIFKGMARRRRARYNLFDYNCQHLVDDVISEAEKEAKRNGESLYLD